MSSDYEKLAWWTCQTCWQQYPDYEALCEHEKEHNANGDETVRYEMKQLLSKAWKESSYSDINVLAAYYDDNNTEVRLAHQGHAITIKLPNSIAKELGLALCAIEAKP